MKKKLRAKFHELRRFVNVSKQNKQSSQFEMLIVMSLTSFYWLKKAITVTYRKYVLIFLAILYIAYNGNEHILVGLATCACLFSLYVTVFALFKDMLDEHTNHELGAFVDSITIRKNFLENLVTTEKRTWVLIDNVVEARNHLLLLEDFLDSPCTKEVPFPIFIHQMNEIIHEQSKLMDLYLKLYKLKKGIA